MNVPDTLRIVLEYTLQIPPEVFDGPLPITARSSFWFRGSPLLVCKQWLDVGTPMLYESAVLRTNLQVNSLAATLQRYGQRGRRLRRLRIEGGYNGELPQILQTTEGLSVLYLGFDDTVQHDPKFNQRYIDLTKANPRRLFLDFPPTLLRDGSPNSLVLRILKESVIQVFPSWRGVEHVDMSLRFDMGPNLPLLLYAAPMLKYISLGFNAASSFIIGGPRSGGVSVLHPIAQNPSVQVIRIRYANGKYPEYACDKLYIGEDMAIRVVDILSRKVPGIVPFHAGTMSRVPEEIMRIIVRYAAHGLEEHEYTVPDIGSLLPDNPTSANHTRSALILVNKNFRRITLPYAYGVPLFSNKYNLDRFVEHITASNAQPLAALVRVLHFPDSADLPKRVLAAFTGLVRASPDFRVFPSLYNQFKRAPMPSPLAWMEQRLGEDFVSSYIWYKFPALRIVILYGGTSGEHDANIGERGLMLLERLHIWNTGDGVITALATARMPRLRDFGFAPANVAEAERFLRVHGHKLTTLAIRGNGSETGHVIEHCPGVVELKLITEDVPSNLAFLAVLSAPLASLRRLSLEAPRRGCHSGSITSHARTWWTLVNDLSAHRRLLPELAEICVLSNIVSWPRLDFIKGVRPSDLNSVIFQAALDMLRDDLGVAFVSLETQAEEVVSLETQAEEVEAKVPLSERWELFQAAPRQR